MRAGQVFVMKGGRSKWLSLGFSVPCSGLVHVCVCGRVRFGQGAQHFRSNDAHMARCVVRKRALRPGGERRIGREGVE